MADLFLDQFREWLQVYVRKSSPSPAIAALGFTAPIGSRSNTYSTSYVSRRNKWNTSGSKTNIWGNMKKPIITTIIQPPATMHLA